MKFTMILPILSIFALSGCIDPMDLEPPANNSTTNTKITNRVKNSVNIDTIKPTPITITDVNDVDKENKLSQYKAKMKKIALTIKDDTNYRKISFDTKEKKEWFRELTFRLWDKQITQEEFMTEALEKYPTHRYEFDFIIKGFSS